jgi:dGTP triphosphohydrolase
MGENQNSREEILKLLDLKFITVAEAIRMLKNLDDEVAQQKVEPEVKKETIEDRINQLAEDALKDMEVEKIVKIMNDMNWSYWNEEVNVQSVSNVIRMVVKSATEQFIRQYNDGNDSYGMCATGGFVAKVFTEENDDEVQVEVNFQPYSGFAGVNVHTLIDGIK